MKKIALGILISLLFHSVAAMAADIEEIIVIGELSKPALRAQIIRVENDIYNFYNEHNGDKKLDIECMEIALTGTHIKQRVCEPVFWSEARQDQTRGLIKEWSGVAELEHLEGLVAEEMVAMNAVYAELIQKYSSFEEALLVLEDLKSRLEELGN